MEYNEEEHDVAVIHTLEDKWHDMEIEAIKPPVIVTTMKRALLKEIISSVTDYANKLM